MNIDLADVQALGIAISAFFITLMVAFLLVFAYRDKIARAMLYAIGSGSIWAWAAYLSYTASDLAIAREFRVVSMLGIVGITSFYANFGFQYLLEYRAAFKIEKAVRFALFAGAVCLAMLLISDLLGTRFVVGEFTASPRTVLAPLPGIFLPSLITYHFAAMVAMAYFLYRALRLAPVGKERRQVRVILFAATAALTLGMTRYASWYGYDVLPQLTILAAPLFIIAAFYAIKSYRMFDIPLATAQLLVFTLWGFTFFRMILSDTLADAWPDIFLFVTSIVIGIFLIRSMLRESKLQTEVQSLLIERTKTEFAMIAAHQLRTPTAGLRWLFESLAVDEKRTLNDEQKHLVSRGVETAQRLTKLINDFLQIVKTSGGSVEYSFESADIGDIVRRAIDSLEDSSSERHVRVDMSVQGDVPRVSVDKEKFSMAIENVIDNAIKYSEAGSQVHVRVSAERASVRIEVQDNGIGISNDEKARIFERFFRGDAARRKFTDGSGIGLFFVKSIVEAHQGSIDMTSPGMNKGTTVVISIPLLRPSTS